jgi:hypothetical protein
MSLADLLGLTGATAGMDPTAGTALTPDQINALPYANVPQQGGLAQRLPHGFLGVGSPVRDFLGRLGDAMLAAGGNTSRPYDKRIHDKEINTALQGYLGNPSGAIANLMQVDAPSAVKLMQAQAKARLEAEQAKPEAVRELQAAGIDPGSDEGKAALQAHLGKAPVAGIAEYQYYRQNGGTLPFADFLRIIHPPADYDLQETGAPAAPRQGAGALRYNPQTGGWDPE